LIKAGGTVVLDPTYVDGVFAMARPRPPARSAFFLGRAGMLL
jgi:hypothetical protein